METTERILGKVNKSVIKIESEQSNPLKETN